MRDEPPKKSAQWISDRTAELGYLVSRSTIADLEIGRRKHVLVPELLVLAAALEVPPMQLLFPDLPHGDTEVLPGVNMRAVDAVLWTVGGVGLPQPSAEDQADADLVAHLSLVSKSIDLESDEDWLDLARKQLEKATTEEERALWADRVLDKEKSVERLKVQLGLQPAPPPSAERRAAYERAQARVQARIEKQKSRERDDG